MKMILLPFAVLRIIVVAIFELQTTEVEADKACLVEKPGHSQLVWLLAYVEASSRDKTI